MKKFITFTLIFALILSSVLTLVSCTGGEEEDTGHNIIVGDPEDDDSPVTPDGETDTESWELGGVPIG